MSLNAYPLLSLPAHHRRAAGGRTPQPGLHGAGGPAAQQGSAGPPGQAGPLVRHQHAHHRPRRDAGAEGGPRGGGRVVGGQRRQPQGRPGAQRRPLPGGHALHAGRPRLPLLRQGGRGRRRPAGAGAHQRTQVAGERRQRDGEQPLEARRHRGVRRAVAGAERALRAGAGRRGRGEGKTVGAGPAEGPVGGMEPGAAEGAGREGGQPSVDGGGETAAADIGQGAGLRWVLHTARGAVPGAGRQQQQHPVPQTERDGEEVTASRGLVRLDGSHASRPVSPTFTFFSVLSTQPSHSCATRNPAENKKPTHGTLQGLLKRRTYQRK